MKNFYRLIPALLLLVSFGCCCAPPPDSLCGSVGVNVACEPMLHSQFTSQRIAAIQQGMTVDQFETIFGPPDRSRERTYGLTRTLIYEYDMDTDPQYPHPSALSNTFYFGVDEKVPYLQNWEINYVHLAPCEEPLKRPVASEIRCAGLLPLLPCVTAQ